MASLDILNEIEVFKKFYNENRDTLKEVSKFFQDLINTCLQDQEPIIHIVTSRVKDCEGCIDKFKDKYKEELETKQEEYEIRNHITDLIGVRVVCLYETDIYVIKDILEKSFERIDEVTDKIKEVNETEDKFRYKGLHLDLKLDSNRKGLPEYKKAAEYRFEVQIRTIIQDAWSNLDHRLNYKNKDDNIPLLLKRRINRLAAVFELADDEFKKIKEEISIYKQEGKKDALDITPFMDIIKHFFSSYSFIDDKLKDFLLHSVLIYNSELTKEQFSEAIEKNFEQVQKFNEHISRMFGLNLNPYTFIRHCLYRYDNITFGMILNYQQKVSFNDWQHKPTKLSRRPTSPY